MLSFLRDKFLSFILPLCVAGGILGSIVWIIGTTYFWNTSSMTLALPGDAPTQVTLSVQARLLYFDVNIFSFFSYPFHLTLPWSKTLTCEKTCTLTHIPSGDASIVALSPSAEPIRAMIFVAPDTVGSLDLRPNLTLQAVTDTSRLNTPPALSAEERASMSIIFSNKVNGLYLAESQGETKMYDVLSRQLLSLPPNIELDSVGRAEIVGAYFLYSAASGMYRYDRYGRTPVTHLETLKYDVWTLSWEGKSTTFIGATGKQTMDGIWWPLRENLMTDGASVIALMEKGK